eukprot:GHVR01002437.1.p1 GENE.GHVR01002437.1~~GHVR01002437.1.p1  ORF type:complete len:476 (-),score=48.66 GHVR01002437.1:19-1446(-)
MISFFVLSVFLILNVICHRDEKFLFDTFKANISKSIRFIPYRGYNVFLFEFGIVKHVQYGNAKTKRHVCVFNVNTNRIILRNDNNLNQYLPGCTKSDGEYGKRRCSSVLGLDWIYIETFQESTNDQRTNKLKKEFPELQFSDCIIGIKGTSYVDKYTRFGNNTFFHNKVFKYSLKRYDHDPFELPRYEPAFILKNKLSKHIEKKTDGKKKNNKKMKYEIIEVRIESSYIFKLYRKTIAVYANSHWESKMVRGTAVFDMSLIRTVISNQKLKELLPKECIQQSKWTKSNNDVLVIMRSMLFQMVPVNSRYFVLTKVDKKLEYGHFSFPQLDSADIEHFWEPNGCAYQLENTPIKFQLDFGNKNKIDISTYFVDKDLFNYRKNHILSTEKIIFTEKDNNRKLERPEETVDPWNFTVDLNSNQDANNMYIGSNLIKNNGMKGAEGDFLHYFRSPMWFTTIEDDFKIVFSKDNNNILLY